MAHFAKLNVSNIVEKVEVVSNNVATSEEAGANFLNNLYGTNDTWIQTSYNTQLGIHVLGGTPFRKNFARPGDTYDPVRDAFIGPKPYASWILNEDKCIWEAPIAYPTDGKVYVWVEEQLNWVDGTTI